MPSGQLFQIGGASSVRGYRQGELAGDGGVYSNFQANYQVTTTLTGFGFGFGFYDYGRIDSSFRQPEKIDSVDAGANWLIGPRLSTEIVVGVPLTNVRDDQEDAYLHMLPEETLEQLEKIAPPPDPIPDPGPL